MSSLGQKTLARSRKLPQKQALTLVRSPPYQYTSEQLDALEGSVADGLLEGHPIKRIAAESGISVKTIQKLKVQYPAFREKLERAAFEGSVIIMEQMRDTPWDELDPQRARVKIEALCRYLELRWPERYGKRLDVTVKTLDIGDALSKARARAATVINSTAYVVHGQPDATDLESVAQPESGIEDLL